MNERASAAIIGCPECEEPMGSAEDWCWNCSEPVERPVVLYPFADYLDDLQAEAHGA